MEVRTIHVQERGESLWHNFEKDRDDEISNADWLFAEEVVVNAIQIDNVGIADGCIHWQLGIATEIFDGLRFVIGFHGC